MVKVIKNNGKPATDLIEVVADSIDDIALVSKNVAMGSTIYVISTGDVYMLNGEREWVKI